MTFCAAYGTGLAFETGTAVRMRTKANCSSARPAPPRDLGAGALAAVEDGIPGPEVRTMLPIKTILFPTDFSEHAAIALPVAAALARDYKARLVLFHARVPSAVTYGEFGALVPESPESLESLRTALEAMRPEGAGYPVECRVAEGDPTAEIVRLAKEVGADMIVMGTHGRSGLGRLVMGSVAEWVLRKAPCPVLTLKAPLPALTPAPTSREPLAVG
jgi:universal stress protein A